MLSRREVIAGGVAGVALAGLPLTASASQASPATSTSLSLFVADRGCASGLAPALAPWGVPLASFAGDPGSVWMDRMEPLWRHGPHAVAGITFGGAFFCLERLARERGLVCTFRAGLAAGADGSVNPALASAVAAELMHAGSMSAALPMREHAPGDAPDRPLAWLLQAASAFPAFRNAGLTRGL